MSHYSKVSTIFKDRAALVKALASVGYNVVEVHDIPQALVGYQGDSRVDKANIIIRRKYVGGASNDLGFVLRQDGSYEAIISDFDSHDHNKTWLNKLSQNYAVHVITETARVENYEIEDQTVDTEGNIYITLEVGD